MSVEVERPQEVPAAVRILLRYLPVGRHDLLMAQAGIQDSVCDCRQDVAEQQLRFRRLPITPGASDSLAERLGRSGGDPVADLADRGLVDPHAEGLGVDQYAKAQDRKRN